jgi:Protein of unknown function (DUF2458)
MDPHGPRNPHLASILQNLAQFTKSSPPIQQHETQSPDNTLAVHSNALANGSVQIQPTGSSLAAPRTPDPRLRSTTPQPDSSKIVDWPPAARYVMHTLSKNAETCSKIKRLIKNQHDNERQWWAGREALIAKHRARGASKKRADELLRSLSGAPAAAPAKEEEGKGEASPTTTEEEKAELERYDRKVYAALGQMVAAMDRELTGLRAPFFAIKHELVQEEKDGNGKGGTITKAELMELQKKMLGLLQDLFGD